MKLGVDVGTGGWWSPQIHVVQCCEGWHVTRRATVGFNKALHGLDHIDRSIHTTHTLLQVLHRGHDCCFLAAARPSERTDERRTS